LFSACASLNASCDVSRITLAPAQTNKKKRGKNCSAPALHTTPLATHRESRLLLHTPTKKKKRENTGKNRPSTTEISNLRRRESRLLQHTYAKKKRD
jgi:hypothetical protein